MRIDKGGLLTPGMVSDLPHLPISKTQNQISYMREELVELGKSDTIPET